MYWILRGPKCLIWSIVSQSALTQVVFTGLAGFSNYCCGENFSVDTYAALMDLTDERSSACVLGVRCCSDELFGEIGVYFRFVQKIWPEKEIGSLKSCRLRFLSKSLRNSKYLILQLLMEQDSTVPCQISCFLRFNSHAFFDSSCEILRTMESATFMFSLSEIISLAH